MTPRLYVDGGPCAAGCGAAYQRRGKTGGGLCSACYAKKRSRPRKPCGCGKPLPPGRSRYCADDCPTAAKSPRATKRKADWDTKGQRHPRTAVLWEMRAEADAEGRKGKCLFCPATLLPGQRLICARVACEAEYQSVYRKGRQKGEAAADVPLSEPEAATDAAVELGAFRQRVACEMDSFRAKVAALARDYGLAA